MILDRGEEVSVNLNRRDAVSTLAVLRGVSLGLPQENGPANSREKRWRAIQMAARGTSQKKKQLKNTARAIGSRVLGCGGGFNHNHDPLHCRLPHYF